MKMRNLIKESREMEILGNRYLVRTYDDKLFFIPRTGADLDRIDSEGRVETAKRLEQYVSETHVPVTWLDSHPISGFAFTTDWDTVIQGM